MGAFRHCLRRCKAGRRPSEDVGGLPLWRSAQRRISGVAQWWLDGLIPVGCGGGRCKLLNFLLATEFLELELNQPAEVLMPELVPAAPEQLAAIRQGMAQPIGSERLAKLAKGKCSVAIVVNDITRPAPSEAMLTVIMEELTDSRHRPGKRHRDCGRGQPRDCRRRRNCKRSPAAGAPGSRSSPITATTTAPLTYVGETARHVPVYVNSYYAKASLKILTGLITPHQSAGFSGGRKSVVPGIAGVKTIATHHSFPIRPEGPVMGIIQGNVFHQEAVAAARLAGVDFIVNVIKNYRGEVVEAVAGDLEQAHARGVEICEKSWVRKFDSGYDVIFVSPGGYPKDIDLHQAQKAVSVAEQVVNPGGHDRLGGGMQKRHRQVWRHAEGSRLGRYGHSQFLQAGFYRRRAYLESLHVCAGLQEVPPAGCDLRDRARGTGGDVHDRLHFACRGGIGRH